MKFFTRLFWGEKVGVGVLQTVRQTSAFLRLTKTVFVKASVCFLVCFTSNDLAAQTLYDWQTTAPDGSLMRGINNGPRWNPGNLWDAPPSTSATRLMFNNNTFTIMTNTVAAGYTIGQLFFGSSATTSRTIGGNYVQFFEFGLTWPRIENQSTTLHTINFPFVASSNSGFDMELVASSGNINFGSLATINNNGRVIQIYGNNSVVDANNRAIRLTGTVSGSGALNVSQFGAAKLNSIHTYTGQTLIDNGELWIESGGGISASIGIFVGNGSLLSNSAKLWLSNSTGGTDFTNSFTINNGNANTRVVGGINTSGINTFSGNITNNSVTGGLNLTALTLGGTTIFSGIISGSGAIIKDGAGQVTLGGANTYSGNTIINTGVLQISGAVDRLPTTTAVTLANTAGAILDLNNLNQTIGSVAGGGGAGGNVILGSGALTVNSGTTTYGGIISGSGSLVKALGGTLTLTGANSYTGATNITGGVLNIQNITATGSIAGGVSVTSGAAIQILNNIAVGAEALTLNGTGISNDGVLRNFNGSNSWSGAITLAGASRINSDAGMLTLSGGITGATIGLTIGGAGNTTISNPITTTTGTLTKDGTGTLVLSGANTYTGATTITSGTIVYNATTSMSSSSAIILGGGKLAIATTPTGNFSAGNLTMTASSTIDVGIGSNAFNLNFAGYGGTFTGTLNIDNWTPAANKNILIPDLTSTQLDNINFNNYGIGAKYDGTTNKVIPKYVYITNCPLGGTFDNPSDWQNFDLPNVTGGIASIYIRPSDNLTQNIPYDLFSINVGGTYNVGGILITIKGAVTPAGFITNTGTINMVATSVINLRNNCTFNNSGIIESVAGSQINFNTGGKLVHTGTPNYTNAVGFINFLGSGTISGTATIPFTTIAGDVDFGTGSTIGTSLVLLTGGSVTGNAPKYGTSSTLFYYQTGSTVGRSLEWVAGISSAASAGYPNNVTVGNGTAVTAVNVNNSTALQMGGNLLISPLSSLTLNDNSTPYNLKVVKDVTISGTLKLGNFVAGPPYIGDLETGGNFTRNAGGTFNPNERAVIFNGTSNQTIDGGGASLSFSYFIVNNSGTAPNNVVKLNNLPDITINGGIGGFPFQMLNGNLDLNGRTVFFNTYNTASNDIRIEGSTGNVTRQIFSTGGTSSFNFTHADNAQRISTVTRNSAAASLLSFSSDILVNIFAGGSGRSGVNFGAGLSTINGSLLINPNTFVSDNPPTYGAASNLIYQTDGSYNRAVEWSSNISGATGYPGNVNVQGGTTLNFLGGGSMSTGCAGNLTIGNPTVAGNGVLNLKNYAAAYNLSVGGDVIIGGLSVTGNLIFSDNIGSDIFIGKGWNRNANGTVNFGAGDGRAVFFNGSANGTITANIGQTFPFLYLVKSSSAASITLADSITITDEIGFTQGNFDLAAKNVTLKSTALKTARVGQSSSANTIFPYSGIGRFVIERNVSALRSWRLLTAPINTNQTIRNAWMEGAAPSTSSPSFFNSNPVANYGTHVTGPSPSSNFFDQSPLNNHSIKYLVGNNWVGIANTAVDITSQKGFMVFIRGDRNFPIESTSTSTSATTTTLRTTGKINIGDRPEITTSGFTVIGNPYPSAINFSSITKIPSAGGSDIYSIWDPKRPSGNTSTTVGGWVTMTRASGTSYVPSVALSSGTIDLTTGRIESGAAIVVNSANLTSLAIKEADKSSFYALVFRPLGEQFSIDKMLRTTLYLRNADNSLSVFDGALHMFDDSYSKDVDGMDAIKLANFNENFGISSHTKILSIEKRLPLTENDTIFFNMAQMRARNYTLELDPLNIAQNNLVGFMEDNYLKTSTPINMDAKTLLNFNIINEPGSYALNRFRLVFKKLIDFTLLKATPVESNVSVDWKVTNEFNISSYEVERSANGENFSRLSTISSTGNSSTTVGYNWMDPSLKPGVYYYRIKCISQNNMVAYSNVEKITFMKPSPAIYIAPNPITSNIIHLQMNKMPAGIYSMRLLNTAGQVIQTCTINHPGTNIQHTISIAKSTAKGTYQVELSAKGKKTILLPVLIQ